MARNMVFGADRPARTLISVIYVAALLLLAVGFWAGVVGIAEWLIHLLVRA